MTTSPAWQENCRDQTRSPLQVSKPNPRVPRISKKGTNTISPAHFAAVQVRPVLCGRDYRPCPKPVWIRVRAAQPEASWVRSGWVPASQLRSGIISITNPANRHGLTLDTGRVTSSVVPNRTIGARHPRASGTGSQRAGGAGPSSDRRRSR